MEKKKNGALFHMFGLGSTRTIVNSLPADPASLFFFLLPRCAILLRFQTRVVLIASNVRATHDPRALELQPPMQHAVVIKEEELPWPQQEFQRKLW